MYPNGHRRQVVLFLVAVVVPSLVVVALGLRMVSQERELNRNRLEEERRRLVSDIRQELLARLERIFGSEARGALAAEAQFRIGSLYERLGRKALAQQAFKTIVSEYADQTTVARQAQAGLPSRRKMGRS